MKASTPAARRTRMVARAAATRLFRISEPQLFFQRTHLGPQGPPARRAHGYRGFPDARRAVGGITIGGPRRSAPLSVWQNSTCVDLPCRNCRSSITSTSMPPRLLEAAGLRFQRRRSRTMNFSAVRIQHHPPDAVAARRSMQQCVLPMPTGMDVERIETSPARARRRYLLRRRMGARVGAPHEGIEGSADRARTANARGRLRGALRGAGRRARVTLISRAAGRPARPQPCGGVARHRRAVHHSSADGG